MTASELANRVGARKSGRGQWVALCPVHGDRSPSLSISEGKTGILLNCRSHQCDVKDICDAWGMKVGSLFHSSRSRPMLDVAKLERLKHRHGWLLIGKVLEPERRSYYQSAIAGIEKDIRKLEDAVYPEKAFRRAIQEQLRRGNFDSLWEMVLPRFADVRESSR